MNASSWLCERTGVDHLLDVLRRKPVPRHRHTVWYYCGGAAAVLFGVQVVTGILLLLYYQPTVDGAHASVVRITEEVPGGWLIRSLHRWTADAAIAFVLVHLGSTLALKAYRAPREVTWLTGCTLFAITLAFGFTGYLLPWDELSVAATRVGTEIPRAVPLAGPTIAALLRGGSDVTADTLSRFFALHVCVLPLVLVFVVAVHLLLIQFHGVSRPLAVEQARGTGERDAMGRVAAQRGDEIPFFPDFVYREAILWLLLFGGLLTTAALWPPALGQAADLLAGAPAGVKPEWYFLGLYQMLRVFAPRVLWIPGETVAVLLMALAVAALFLVPFVDRHPDGRSGRWVRRTAAAALLYMVVMTVWGYAV